MIEQRWKPVKQSLSKFFCLIGFHSWNYLPNIGVRYYRRCVNCRKRQCMFTVQRSPYIYYQNDWTWVDIDYDVPVVDEDE